MQPQGSQKGDDSSSEGLLKMWPSTDPPATPHLRRQPQQRARDRTSISLPPPLSKKIKPPKITDAPSESAAASSAEEAAGTQDGQRLLGGILIYCSSARSAHTHHHVCTHTRFY